MLLSTLTLASPARAAPDCPALPAVTPLPREATPEFLDIPEWRDRLTQLDQRLQTVDRGSARLVFLGDSLTQSWDPPVFQKYFGARNALNLGLWGDFTQGLLWRLNHGEWDGLHPDVAVLLIGTNNTSYDGKPEDVALGIAETVRFIHRHSPRTKVLILALLPRGADAANRFRPINARTSALAARCADNRTTFFLDIGAQLLDAKGALADDISFDQLHLTPKGYVILSEAIEPTLKKLLGTP